MKIVLIGAGNLSTHLGKALISSGHDIIQVFSRTMENASTLAELVGGSPTNDINNIAYDGDAYIMSIKDSVMPDIIPIVCKGREKKVFLHTAGSMPMDVFKGMAIHYGVLYPMQTFSKNKSVDFKEIPCFIEANDQYALNAIENLASSVSNHVSMLSSEDRRYLHLSAVFACNFVNHCYSISERILAKRGIPFSTLLPLIDETAQKVHTMSPVKAQTGPAVRFDNNVIREQSALLKTDPLIKDIYERMSLSIHRFTELDRNDKL